MPRVYLAGPDVFAADPAAAGQALKAVCRDAGLEGCFPLDAVLRDDGSGAQRLAQRIAWANEDLIASCDGLLANLTPFRGPSADAGTVYEVGFALGLGKPVVGYSDASEGFSERTARWLKCCGQSVRARTDGTWEDPEGMQIESFGLTDNLMIPSGIERCGGQLVGLEAAQRAGERPLTLAARRLSELLRSRRS